MPTEAAAGSPSSTGTCSTRWRVRTWSRRSWFFPGPQELRTGPIPEKVRQLPPRAGKAGVRGAFAARSARDLGPFDVVFCGHLFAAPLAATVARLAGAQYWQQLHGIEAWSCPGRIVRRAVEGATLVTAVSRHTRRLFLSWARNAPESVKVLPNTVDERFHPGPKPAGLLSRYGLTGKDRVADGVAAGCGRAVQGARSGDPGVGPVASGAPGSGVRHRG